MMIDDQRMLLVNMLAFWATLFFFVGTFCFFRYIRLVRRHWTGVVTGPRYRMIRHKQRENCNKLFWITVAATLIIYAAVELGFQL